METAVITLAVGHQSFWAVTHPIFQRYANRIKASFHVIDQARSNSNITHAYKLEKFQLWHYLDQYKRILFIDSDIAIHPRCPNLFELVSEDDLGVVCEKLPYFNREAIFLEACQFYGVPYPGNAQSWFNTGLMVLSQSHRNLFSSSHKIRSFVARNMDGSVASNFSWLDMPYLNCRRLALNLSYHDLGYRFNYFQQLKDHKLPPLQHDDFWIFHASGADKSSLFDITNQWYPNLEQTAPRIHATKLPRDA